MKRHISIHALREEGDSVAIPSSGQLMHFYPRPPRGGRPVETYLDANSWDISIHALREEGDWQTRRFNHDVQDFYPRPPRGGRLSDHQPGLLLFSISIHALREEGDSKNREKTLCFCLIIHLPAQIAKRCL